MTLRYHHKLVFSVLIVFGILVAIVAIAQDQETLRIESAYGAEDPRFPPYLATLLGTAASTGNRYQVLANGDQLFPPMLDAIASRAAADQFRDLHLSDGEASASSSRRRWKVRRSAASR